MDEIFTNRDLSNDLLVCLPVELRRQITMLTAHQTVGDRAAKNKLAPRVGVAMVLSTVGCGKVGPAQVRCVGLSREGLGISTMPLNFKLSFACLKSNLL